MKKIILLILTLFAALILKSQSHTAHRDGIYYVYDENIPDLIYSDKFESRAEATFVIYEENGIYVWLMKTISIKNSRDGKVIDDTSPNGYYTIFLRIDPKHMSDGVPAIFYKFNDGTILEQKISDSQNLWHGGEGALIFDSSDEIINSFINYDLVKIRVYNVKTKTSTDIIIQPEKIKYNREKIQIIKNSSFKSIRLSSISDKIIGF